MSAGLGRCPLAVLVLLLTVACAPSADLPIETLEPLPSLDLSTVEPVARQQLEERRGDVERLLKKAEDARQLAEGFGDLGELYHAYQMFDAAAVCYRNAQTLDPGAFLWPYLLAVAEQRSGRFAEAVDAYRRALELRPDHEPARLRLAEAHLALGQKAEAAALLEPLKDEEDYAAAAYFGLGRAAEDPAVAVEAFEKALQLDPAASAVRHPLGLALRRLGRDEEARQALAEEGAEPVSFPDPPLERIAELAVGAGAHLRRGNQALMRNDFTTAAAAYRRAVEAQPENVEARRNLALALSRDGRVDEAIVELQRALEDQPDSVWLHYDLGNLLMARGRPEAAIEALQKAVALAPDLEPALFNLGNALIGLGRWGEAREVLQKLLELDAGDPQARYLLAVARGESGERQQAIEELQRLLRDDPAQLAPRRSLAKMLLDDQRPEEALAVYRRGLEVDLEPPARSELLGLLAELEWRRGRKGKAIEAFEQAVAVEPGSSQAHTRLANALQLAGQRRRAAQSFARAVELDPRNATAWLSEGTLWILLGEYQKARQRLEQALELHPENIELVHTLARLLATSPDPTARDGRQAMILAQQAFGQQKKPEYAETVAMAMAELGQFEQAIQWQRSLMARAARLQQQALLQQMAAHLRLYEQGRPVRIETGR